MDPWTAEQLSRLLDGDLDAAAEERLQARLAAEPALAAELESLRRLQAHVRAVAERMEPPAVLDAALKPLASGTPAAPRRLPTPVRWLGIAAGLALAVTVALEVARRPPEPVVTPDRGVVTPEPAPGSSELFQLQPLPTRAAQAGDEPLGAAERLVASPYAEPSLPEVAPLDVRGPLPEAEGDRLSNEQRFERQRAADGIGSEREQAPSAHRSDDTAKGAASSDGGGDRSGTRLPAAGAPEDRRRVMSEAPGAEGRFETGARPGEAVAGAARGAAKEPSRPARLIVSAPDGTTLAELEIEGVTADMPSMVVTVGGGVVTAIERAGGAEAGAVLEKLVGREVPGLPDGRYRATLEPSAP